MSFLAPLAFLLLVTIPVVIAMYLLRLRRVEQEVSSIYLWQRMVRDVEANAPWQRLRRNLLLLLQLVFLALLILALARPFTWSEGRGSQATILIIDTSGSMSATDIQPNRLESARLQARRVVDELPDNARLTVISAGASAEVLLASSQDRRQVYLALDKLTAQPGGSDMENALELASAIAARQEDAEIVVLSDGNVILPARLGVQGRIRYLPVGTDGQNQAISLLTLEPAADGSITAFAQVSNYESPPREPAPRRIVFLADGKPLQAYDLEIPAGSQEAVLAAGFSPETRIIEARLDGEDQLQLDDHAWAVNRSGDPVRVNLVSEGNRFLETGLRLLPGLEVTTIRPEDWQESSTADDERDPPVLTIFDQFIPADSALPPSNLLFIGPLSSNDYFTIRGVVEQPQLRLAAPEDPLLEDISGLDTINILDAAWINLPDWARPVLVTDTEEGQIPVLFRGEPQGRRIAVLSFSLSRSDLPLQVAFPVLLANLMNWLAPADVDLPTQVEIGDTLSLSLPEGTTNATLILPDGTRQPLEAQGNQFLTPPIDQLGTYMVEWGPEDQATFAVNLFSSQESHILPAGELPFEGVGTSLENSRNQLAKREWWRPLVWLGLVVLIIEWFVYHRANVRRLSDRLIKLFGFQKDLEGRTPTPPRYR